MQLLTTLNPLPPTAILISVSPLSMGAHLLEPPQTSWRFPEKIKGPKSARGSWESLWIAPNQGWTCRVFTLKKRPRSPPTKAWFGPDSLVQRGSQELSEFPVRMRIAECCNFSSALDLLEELQNVLLSSFLKGTQRVPTKISDFGGAKATPTVNMKLNLQRQR